MWGLVALIFVLLLVGCAFAMGDGSTADVRVNSFPSVSIDADEQQAKPKKD